VESLDFQLSRASTDLPPLSARAFLGLESTHDSCRWVLPVTPGVCSPAGFLFGGCALAAAIAALEAATARSLIWATAQFLSYARPPEVLDLEVHLAVSGRHITQGRVVGHVAEREVLTVTAALGRRELAQEGTWAVMPEVPPPSQCARRELRASAAGYGLSERLHTRLALARSLSELPGPGVVDARSALWVKLSGIIEMSPASLAILGDYVPFGIGQALGLRAGGNSLDNTLRIGQMVPSEWVLVDIRIHQVVNGIGHGEVHLWSENGVLVGTASQSTVVRLWADQLAHSPGES
jgi:acyl-CoA thioesterase II